MDTQTMDQAQAQHIFAAMMPIFFVVGLVFMALIIVPLWIAFKKAGLSGALSLLVFVPVIGPLLPLYVLAFAKWKVVPAPDYGYVPPAVPAPVSYAPVYAQSQPAAPPVAGYSAPGAYTPAPVNPPAYPPPSDPPAQV